MEKYYLNLSLEDIKDEIWKPLLRFNNEYEVSSKGRLKSKQRKKRGRIYPTRIIKTSTDKDGYIRTSLSNFGVRKDVRIHRLVSEAFLSNNEGKPFVNHKNGIVWDNRVENLEWVTHLENTRHAIANGLTVKGFGRKGETLKEWQVIDIFNSNKTVAYLSKKYKTSVGSIRNIISGKSWGWLTNKKYEPNYKGIWNKKFLIVNGERVSYTMVAKMLKTSCAAISYRVKSGWDIEDIIKPVNRKTK